MNFTVSHLKWEVHNENILHKYFWYWLTIAWLFLWNISWIQKENKLSFMVLYSNNIFLTFLMNNNFCYQNVQRWMSSYDRKLVSVSPWGNSSLLVLCAAKIWRPGGPNWGKNEAITLGKAAYRQLLQKKVFLALIFNISVFRVQN